MNLISCPLCSGTKIRKLNFSQFNTYTHLNFNKFRTNHIRILSQCYKCKLLFNNNYQINSKKIKKKIQSKSYINHIEYTSVNENNLNSILIDQSKLIISLLPKKNNNSILDFGCFDGSLLNEIYLNDSSNTLYGYDIIKSKNFVNNKKINFIDKFNYLKKQKYDFIILSHSFMYIDDVDKILLDLFSLLKQNGGIYFQFPKIEVRPLFLLLDDQLYFPTIKPVYNFLKKNNIHKIKIIDKFLPKDNVILGYNSKKIKTNNLKISNINLKTYRNKLVSYLKKITKINLSKKNYYIFGTTIEARFLSDYLKNIKGFVDESLIKKNKKFCRKKIYHPSSLSKNSQIIFIGNRYESIIKKIKINYNFNCILIR